MRRCRKCNRDWPDTMTACPNDGWSLTAGTDPTYAAPNVPVAPPGASTAIAAAPTPAADPAMMADLAPGFVVGEYRIEKKIGEGGMGAVYSRDAPADRQARRDQGDQRGARHRRRRRSSASCRRRARSTRSATRTSSTCSRSASCPTGAATSSWSGCRARASRDRMQRGALPLGEAIEILDQVADALEAAHEKRIVHRDLKPDNVFLVAVRGGRTMVKLLDFGIAKLSAPTDGAAHREDAHRHDDGHARLHVAGAGARQERRSPHRHLRARLHGVRDGRAAGCRSSPTTRWTSCSCT